MFSTRSKLASTHRLGHVGTSLCGRTSFYTRAVTEMRQGDLLAGLNYYFSCVTIADATPNTSESAPDLLFKPIVKATDTVVTFRQSNRQPLVSFGIFFFV